MPKGKLERTPLNLRALREKALLGRTELAEKLGLSVQILVILESGNGSPRLATLYQLALVLADYLQKPPSEVFDTLIPDELYFRVEPIRNGSAAFLAQKDHQGGNLKTKRKFLRRQETRFYDEKPPEAVSFSRLQKLFAESYFSKVEVADLAEVSYRRLNQIFTVSSERTGNMTLGLFLRLAATLAPVYGDGVRATAAHLLGGDLEQLDELYSERQAGRGVS